MKVHVEATNIFTKSKITQKNSDKGKSVAVHSILIDGMDEIPYNSPTAAV